MSINNAVHAPPATDKQHRAGKKVIERSHNIIFDSVRQAADYFSISHFDVRQYCQFKESGYVINHQANKRIDDSGLIFEFVTPMTIKGYNDSRNSSNNHANNAAQ